MPDTTPASAPGAATPPPAAAPGTHAGLPTEARRAAPPAPGAHTPEGQQKSFAELVTRIASIGAQAFHRVKNGRSDEPRVAYTEMVARFSQSPVGESVGRIATQAWAHVPPKTRPWVMIGVGALNVALMVYEGYDQHRHPKKPTP